MSSTTPVTTSTATFSNLSDSDSTVPPPPAPTPTTEPEYELLLLSTGTLTERSSSSPPLTGRLQVLQRRLPNNVGDYMAILSVEDVNLPLGVGQPCNHSNGNSWDIKTQDGRMFCVECTGEEREKQLLEEILRWFMRVDGKKEGGWAAWIEGLGEKGEKFVDKIGDGVLNRVETKLGPNQIPVYEDVPVDSTDNGANERRNLKLGGKVTKGVLGGVRGVTDKGAQVAHGVTEKVSDAVGSVLGSNPIMKNFRNAPKDSKRFRFQKILSAGMAAVGKVYLKADEKGKVIIETTGDGLGKKAGENYGEEAEHATRNIGRIGLNSYRILRFPNKLGAKALLKGAIKGAMKERGQDAVVAGPGGTGPFVPSSSPA